MLKHNCYCKDFEDMKFTYRITGVGSLNLGQAFNICVKNVHLLHQACESSLCGFTHLLIHTFGLDTHIEN